MSIPCYQDVYRFPGGYPPPHGHHHGQRHGFQPSYARETSKSIDICDKFNNLRYVVELSSILTSDGRAYKVTVSQLLKDGLVTFLQIPDGDGYETSYEEAMHAFDTCVKKYQSLVNAEMRDFRDIDVYKDKIDYRVQEPRCCSNCKWCMKTFERDVHSRCCKPDGKPIKMQCCNPLNQQVFNYAEQYPQFPSGRCIKSWQKLPWQKPDDIKHLYRPQWKPDDWPNVMFPTVQPLGICENYISGECEYNRHHWPKMCNCDNIEATIAPQFDPTAAYNAGDLVYYGGKLYECLLDDTAGNWNPSRFVQTTVEDELKKRITEQQMSSMLSDYTTSDDVGGMISDALEPYATRQYVDDAVEPCAAKSDLSAYVRTDVLSGTAITKNPTQRQIADVVKAQLSVLGGKVE